MTDKTQPTAALGKYWARLCALPKFSFILSAAGGVARAQDSCGNWVEASAVQQIVDDAESRIAELEALQAAPPAPAAVAVPLKEALAMFPMQLDGQTFTVVGVNNGKPLEADGDNTFYSKRKVVAFLTELRGHIDAALAAAPALASDTESVLIDGIAYEVPAAVAGELLSLHLDLIAAAPAQEHATQLAGQGQDLEVTDEMALAFHRAISDGAIGQDDVDEIKDGLRAAFCNIAAPAQAQEDARDALTQAARDVLAERQRQISNEGRSADADDLYQARELAAAAATYVLMAGGLQIEHAWARWPWPAGLKEGAPRRMLEKAGALILAEMERLDRAAARAAQGGA